MSDQFTGTKPVEERHRFDLARLESWLRRNVEGYSGPLEVEQFKGGQSNPTYRLSAGGRRYALRRKPPGKLLPSAHAVDREYRVIKALHGAGFPVARPYGLCTDDSVVGTMFYVTDCIEGRVLWDQSLPGASRAERSAIWDELNRVIAQLHGIDYNAIGLADFGKPGNYIARQVDRWTKQYRASETEKIESMDHLIEWLPKNIPAGDETVIVHGDYRLDNTIFHSSRAEDPRGARLGTLDARAPARRFRLPLHELAHPAGAVPRHRRARLRCARHSHRAALHRGLLQAHRPRRGVGVGLGFLHGVQPVPHRRHPAGES